MVTFKFLGMTPPPGVVATMGPVKEFRIPLKDGSTYVVTAPRPEGFRKDDTFEVPNDSRAIRALTVDPKFAQV